MKMFSRRQTASTHWQLHLVVLRLHSYGIFGMLSLCCFGIGQEEDASGANFLRSVPSPVAGCIAENAGCFASFMLEMFQMVNTNLAFKQEYRTCFLFKAFLQG